MKFDRDDMRLMLESEVGLYQPKRKACKKCDYYGSVKHAGIACTKCGGEMVDVSKWTIENLLIRSSVHCRDITSWLPVLVAHYLSLRDSLDFSDCNSFACSIIPQLREMYNATKKGPQ